MQNNLKGRFDIIMQDRLYPFGRYPKIKYEAVVGNAFDTNNIIYSFVTTIYTEAESIEILYEKIVAHTNHKEWMRMNAVVRLYKNVENRGRVVIGQVKPIDLL